MFTQTMLFQTILHQANLIPAALTQGTTIPQDTITSIGTAASLCFLLPILVLIAYKKNTRAKLRPFIYGVIMFFAFSMGFQQMAHLLFLMIDSPVSRFIGSHVWAYALYSALAAGILEETGRFVAFHLLKDEHQDKNIPIMYGIGHGGSEAILIGAISLLNLMTVALSINVAGLGTFMESLGEAAAGIQPTIDSLLSTPPSMYFLSVLERVSALILQLSLSVLVWLSVAKRGLRLLFPAAIGLHALVDLFAALYQTDVIGDLFLLEAGVVLYSAGVAYLAFRLYRKHAPASQK